MKKLIITILALGGLYYASVLVRAKQSEWRAEKYAAFLFSEISTPWSAKKMREYCSVWLCDESKSKITPEEIARLAEQDYGSFQEFVKEPDCNGQSGYEKIGGEKIIFATCKLTARFQKQTAQMTILLVEEPMPPSSLFRKIGESWKFGGFSEIENIK
jgi:hypothetical protein